MTSPFVVRLDRASPAAPELGGKGAWLARLFAAGFDVPTTAVLTTDAYRAVAADRTLQALFAQLREASAAGIDGPDAHDVDEAFLRAPIDQDVRVAIHDAAAATLTGPGGRVAVRSSASAEDMHGTSFAGQYTSFLDVEADGVERAVRLVWASLWHPSPRAYRTAQGVDESDLAMAVVLMQQLPADQAGVVFTVDPGGAAGAARVEGVAGLGERLVSGAETPWVALVPRGDTAHGPVELSDDAPPGTDALARRVATVAIEIERAFGDPQDVEWALVGDHLSILQARPITTIGRRDDGFDSTTRPDQRWTTAGIAEMLPGPLPPLVWQVNHRLIEEALRQHFDQLRALPRDIDDRGGFLARFRARAAVSLDAMEAIAAAMPGAQTEEVERQYFGLATDERPASPVARRRGWRGLAHDRYLARERREARTESATVVEAVSIVVAEAPDPSTLSDDDLLAYRARVLDLAGRTMAAEVAVAASAVAAYRRLEIVLLKHFDERGASRWAQRVTTGTARARDRGATPHASRAVFAGPTWLEDDAARASAAGTGDDSGGETGGETVGSLVGGLAGGLASVAAPRGQGVTPTTIQQAWEELLAALRSRQGWNAARALTGQVVDVRLMVLRRVVEDANELLDLREDTKAAVLALGGVVRQIHLEQGRRAVAAGRLQEATQVDALSEAELLGTVTTPTRAEVARRTRWLSAQVESPLPQQFRGPPPPAAHVMARGPVLHGWAAGPGRHTGRARVLTSPRAADVEPGDVVVATTTDASWAPVFLRAGAIVVEQGGPLSHAAIVARELGIPAVLNIPGVVARLAGGELIVTVDGDEGLVLVVDPDAVGATQEATGVA